MQRIARWLTALVVVAAAIGLVMYRMSWHNWPWQGDPARLTLCERHYDPASRPVVLQRGRLHVEYRVPWLIGREVVSTRTPRQRRSPPGNGAACTGLLYLSLGAGRYREYELSGGP